MQFNILKKSKPVYYGPRGGKWADPQHTIPYNDVVSWGNKFSTYYDASDNQSINTYIRNWQKEKKKARSSERKVAMVDIKQLIPHREYNWTREKARRSPEEWDRLKTSMKEKGWDENDPLIFHIGKTGAKVGEGNHRLAIAQEIGIKKIPVRFIFETGMVEKTDLVELEHRNKQLIEERKKQAVIEKKENEECEHKAAEQKKKDVLLTPKQRVEKEKDIDELMSLVFGTWKSERFHIDLEKAGKEWVGVDLDGTLAEYHKWKGEGYIGHPVLKMVERVQKWLKEGKTVKILTARANPENNGSDASDRVIETIQDWSEKWIGKRLPVVCSKDMNMIELWDDRAVQVKENTGERVDGLKKAGPYIGPKGGKWEDPEHTIPYGYKGDRGGKEHVKALARHLEKQHGAKVVVSHHKGITKIHSIVVPKEKRGQGTGDAIMGAIKRHADKYGHKIALTPDPSLGGGGGSKARLKKWYKRHGFVENKGRNRDYEHMEEMHREPSTTMKKSIPWKFVISSETRQKIEDIEKAYQRTKLVVSGPY